MDLLFVVLRRATARVFSATDILLAWGIRKPFAKLGLSNLQPQCSREPEGPPLLKATPRNACNASGAIDQSAANCRMRASTSSRRACA